MDYKLKKFIVIYWKAILKFKRAYSGLVPRLILTRIRACDTRTKADSAKSLHHWAVVSFWLNINHLSPQAYFYRKISCVAAQCSTSSRTRNRENYL